MGEPATEKEHKQKKNRENTKNIKSLHVCAEWDAYTQYISVYEFVGSQNYAITCVHNFAYLSHNLATSCTSDLIPTLFALSEQLSESVFISCGASQGTQYWLLIAYNFNDIWLYTHIYIVGLLAKVHK